MKNTDNQLQSIKNKARVKSWEKVKNVTEALSKKMKHLTKEGMDKLNADQLQFIQEFLLNKLHHTGGHMLKGTMNYTDEDNEYVYILSLNLSKVSRELSLRIKVAKWVNRKYNLSGEKRN